MTVNTATITIQGKSAPPDDITDLTVSWDAIHRMMRFSWTHVEDIDLSHYEIREGATWATATFLLRTTEATASHLIDTDFDGSITYSIKAVDTTNNESETADTEEITFVTTANDLLLVPTGLAFDSSSNITTDGTDSVILEASWNTNAEAYLRFSHYIFRLEDDSNSLVTETAVGSAFFQGPVLPNHDYTISVKSVDTAGNQSAFSGEVTDTTVKDATPPNTPTSLVAEGRDLQILLTWNHSAEADLAHFLVYRHTANVSGSAVQIGSAVAESSGSLGTFSDTPPDDSTYYYWVKAVDSSGNISGFSNSDSDAVAGVEGLSGVDSRTVNLTAVTMGFTYDKNGSNVSPGSSVITATALNTEGTPYYRFLVNDVQQQHTTSNTYSYTPQSSYDNMPDKIVVELREGGTGGTVYARDQITLVGMRDGAAAVTVVFPNEAHTVPATSVGAVTDYSGSGSTVRVYDGDDLLTFHTSIATGRFTIGTPTISPAGDITVGGRSGSGTTTCTIADSSAMDNNTDLVTISYPISVRKFDGTNLSLTVVQTVSKSKGGAEGSEGVDARAVNLIASDQGFTYNTSGLIPSPSSATVTATALNTAGTVYYRFWKNDVSVQHTTSNTYSYSPQTSYDDMPDKIEVEIREDGTGNPVLASDQMTLMGLKEGGSAISLLLTNEAHTLPTTTAGVVTYTGSGTDIKAWLGATAIPYSAASPGFQITTSDTDITVGSASTVSTYTRRFADSSNMTEDLASITFTITVKDEAGIPTVFTRVQSLSKSWQGDTGDDGDPGKTYTLSITGGARAFTWDAAGTAYEPTATALTGVLEEDGIGVSPTFAWTTGGTSTGLISGSGSSSTFTPTVTSTWNAVKGNNWIALECTYAGQTISQTVPISCTKVGIDTTNWSSDIVFTSTAYNSVTWTTGLIKSGGTTYSGIAGGSKGSILENFPQYIYFDPEDDDGILQATSDPTVAVDIGNVILAFAKYNTDTDGIAILSVFGGTGGSVVAADQVTTNNLSAISADIGTVTLGVIESDNFDSSNGMQIDLTNANMIVREDTGLTIESVGGITVADGGGITVEDGGDIILLSDYLSATPSKIIYEAPPSGTYDWSDMEIYSYYGTTTYNGTKGLTTINVNLDHQSGLTDITQLLVDDFDFIHLDTSGFSMIEIGGYGSTSDKIEVLGYGEVELTAMSHSVNKTSGTIMKDNHTIIWSDNNAMLFTVSNETHAHVLANDYFGGIRTGYSKFYVKDDGELGIYGNILPSVTNTINIGATDKIINTIHVNDINLTNDLLPVTTNTSDIGSTTKVVKDIYTGGLYLGGTVAANKMDDYEEGEYTPVLKAGTTSLTLYTTADTLAYTKIGRQVSITGQIKISDTRPNLDTENLTISMPIAYDVDNLTDASEQFTATVGYVGVTALAGSLQMVGVAGTVAYLVDQTTTGQLYSIADHVGEDTILYLSFTYFTDA